MRLNDPASPLRSAVRFEIRELEREGGYGNEYWEDDIKAWGLWEQVHPITHKGIDVVYEGEGFTLYPLSGRPQPQPLVLPFFAWHGWNHNYVSGHSQWYDGANWHIYGVQFQRV